MKALKLTIAFAACSFLFIGCANKASQPNSTISTATTASNDAYKDLSPEVLLKQAKAHFDLDEFQKSQQKITVLLQEHPETSEANEAENFLPLLEEKLKEVKIALKQKAQDSLRLERQKRLPNALEKMRKTTTNNGLSHFIDKSSPEFNTKECFYAYFTKGSQNPKLYFKIRYVSSNWLNMENVVITVDQKDYSLKDTIRKDETNGKKKLKIEILDTAIDSKEKHEILRAIADGKSVTAAYVGATDYKKRAITEEQRLAIRNVLDAYEFYGGPEFDL